jgi:hypothetical protein
MMEGKKEGGELQRQREGKKSRRQVRQRSIPRGIRFISPASSFVAKPERQSITNERRKKRKREGSGERGRKLKFSTHRRLGSAVQSCG